VKRIGAFVDLPRFDRIDGPGAGMILAKSGAGGKLGRPVTDSALAHARERLGFPLPAPLVQLYRLADGGFGPGDSGLLSLARMIETYRRLTASPDTEPAWKPWPAKRLPLFESGDSLGCLDLETGRVAVYEISGMDFPSSRDWRRGADEWESLTAMMESWLGSRPSCDETLRRAG
jgi:hypothetical protein